MDGRMTLTTDHNSSVQLRMSHSVVLFVPVVISFDFGAEKKLKAQHRALN